MITLESALEAILAQAKPLGTQTVTLLDASGRRLAEPVFAEIDAPDRAVSAMDGYAVREADLTSLPASLAIVRECFAGEAIPGKIEPGECARIFTGAPLPDGADRVVIQEVVKQFGTRADFAAALTNAYHVRAKASDFAAGDKLLAAGRTLDPRALLAAAAGDHDSVVCWRQPSVHLLSTGDELVAPGKARTAAGAIPDSLSFGITALARMWGAKCVSSERLRDSLEQMEQAAENALINADVVVVTGGASVGERDFAKKMFAPAGLELFFEKVAIKPGKPVWFGMAQGRLVMGLPGNPTSAMVTARLMLAPLLLGLSGGDPVEAQQWRKLPLGAELEMAGPREKFVRARLTAGEVIPLINQDSAAQCSLADADLLIRLPENEAAHLPGDMVQVLDF